MRLSLSSRLRFGAEFEAPGRGPHGLCRVCSRCRWTAPTMRAPPAGEYRPVNVRSPPLRSQSVSEQPPAAAPAEEPWLEVTGSRLTPGWLAEQRVSLAFTTYQTGKLFLLGLKPDGQLAVNERTFNRCMGLWGDGQALWTSTKYQLWRFENLLKPGEAYQQHDRLYVPKMGYTTADLDVHDVAID